mmetsp:Transcript_29039/g.83375  ORF Transcript_29039/g.83375 Transcript_29039/m.83375 type:complete len:204 (+) Transcript_29039:904-1515(+)
MRAWPRMPLGHPSTWPRKPRAGHPVLQHAQPPIEPAPRPTWPSEQRHGLRARRAPAAFGPAPPQGPALPLPKHARADAAKRPPQQHDLPAEPPTPLGSPSPSQPVFRRPQPSAAPKPTWPHPVRCSGAPTAQLAQRPPSAALGSAVPALRRGRSTPAPRRRPPARPRRPFCAPPTAARRKPNGFAQPPCGQKQPLHVLLRARN